MKRDLPKFLKEKAAKGFTLIELLVVIAILGVLAVLLITVIDPVDKINSANDAGVVGTMRQVGQANDAYAANNQNLYVQAVAFAAAVTALNTQGEIKQSSLTAPNGYTYTYFGVATCDTVPANCTSYSIHVNLKAKKDTSTPFYVYANGKGCKVATAPTVSTFACP